MEEPPTKRRKECELEDEEAPLCDSELTDYETVDEVDVMLEERFGDDKQKKEPDFETKQKVVLVEIAHDHFDLLPAGWVKLTHGSGMPLYLHQESRVCTMARPYDLGIGSARNHKTPLSAIPCLQYRRALEHEEKENKEGKETKSGQGENGLNIQFMAAKIETTEENESTQSIDASNLREYCQKLFSFKTVKSMPFKSWADRRKYVRMSKELKTRQRPTLPVGTKLLKMPSNGSSSISNGESIINLNGKSYICILHEYIQHTFKKHPKYKIKETENPSKPFLATVFFDDMQYGIGMGQSKKQAKAEAAKATLEIFIPEMKDKIKQDGQFGVRSEITQRSLDSDYTIFDQIKIEDPRITEYCTKISEPSPYVILLTCLARNPGFGEIQVNYELSAKKYEPATYRMRVGKHEVTVSCKNKREGKQLAAQALLKALHLNLTYWGPLLRLYGNSSIKNLQEKKEQEKEVTSLQNKGHPNQPNHALINKLQTEMLKLKEKRDALKSIGKFIPPNNVSIPLISTDLGNIFL